MCSGVASVGVAENPFLVRVIPHLPGLPQSVNLALVNKTIQIAASLFALLLAGCNSLPQRPAQAGPDAPPATTRELPFEEPERRVGELDEDLVFSYLAGEIGAKQGDLHGALIHYLHAAMLADDPYAAERATRIALHLKDTERGLRAVKRWVEVAPNSLVARQLGGVLLLQDGDRAAALEQFRAVVEIAEALGKDGMLLVAGTLNSNTDQAGALQVLKQLVSEHPEDARSYYALAISLTAFKQYPEAESALYQAIRLRPAWALPHVLLSRVLVALDRPADGVKHLSDALQANPDDQVLRLSYARLLVANREYEPALDQFRRLHAAKPDDHEVGYAYAMLSTQQQDWDEARMLWQALRNIPKYHEEATYFLAQVEEMAGNEEMAIGLYRSINEGQYRVDAAIRAAGLLSEAGKLGLAREQLAGARISHAERGADLYLAETQMLQKADADTGLILNLYATAIDAFPKSNDLLYNRGLFYSELGDFERMESDFRQVLSRDEDHAEALNALGYVLADRGIRLQEALGYIQRAHRLKPDNPAILDSLGWVHYRMGELEKALRYLREAVQDNSDDEIASHLGEVLWVSGREQEARQVWAEALEANPGSSHIRSVMDRLLPGQ